MNACIKTCFFLPTITTYKNGKMNKKNKNYFNYMYRCVY